MWHTFAETVVFTLPCCGCSCLARLLGARAFYMTFFPWLTVSILTLHRNAFHMYTLGSCINPSVYTKIYSCKNIIGTGRDTYEDHCAGGHAGSLQVCLTHPLKPGVEEGVGRARAGCTVRIRSSSPTRETGSSLT